jgi:cytochrome P450
MMSDDRPTAGAGDLPGIDLTNTALYRRGFPHDVFTKLRSEAPVWWQAIPEEVKGCADEGVWVLSRHRDVQAANRDTVLFSAVDGPALIDRPEMRGAMLVSMDGREHTRQRRLINAGFTPRMVGRLEEQMRQRAASIVERALERGTCDFVADVAYQLPMHMIADIVGIPVEDRQWLFDLTNKFLQAGDPESGLSARDQLALQLEMFEYGRKLGRDKRARPRDDVWTILSTVEIETDDGGRTALDELELDLFFLLLTVAGSETTRNAISLGLMALLDEPEQLETLRNEPAVMETAVEEILRWSSPVSYFARRATRDTEIRGVPIAAGQRVTLWYASANRDESVFDDPFRFVHRRDLRRVLLGDRLALELHGRSQLVAARLPVLGQDRELLDLLDARQLLVGRRRRRLHGARSPLVAASSAIDWRRRGPFCAAQTGA